MRNYKAHRSFGFIHPRLRAEDASDPEKLTGTHKRKISSKNPVELKDLGRGSLAKQKKFRQLMLYSSQTPQKKIKKTPSPYLHPCQQRLNGNLRFLSLLDRNEVPQHTCQDALERAKQEAGTLMTDSKISPKHSVHGGHMGNLDSYLHLAIMKLPSPYPLA